MSTPHYLVWACPVDRSCGCDRDSACSCVRVTDAERPKRISPREYARTLDSHPIEIDGKRTRTGHGVTVCYASGKSAEVRS